MKSWGNNEISSVMTTLARKHIIHLQTKLKHSPHLTSRTPSWIFFWNTSQLWMERQWTGTSIGASSWLHQNVIYNIFKVPDAIEDTIKWWKFKTKSELVFIVLELGLISIILSRRLENNGTKKYGGVVLIDIGAYQKVQVSEKTFFTNAWDNLIYLNIVAQFQGGRYPSSTNEMKPYRIWEI